MYVMYSFGLAYCLQLAPAKLHPYKTPSPRAGLCSLLCKFLADCSAIVDGKKKHGPCNGMWEGAVLGGAPSRRPMDFEGLSTPYLVFLSSFHSMLFLIHVGAGLCSFWNFDALFQPQQHPARDAHDTFFLTRACLHL